MSRRRTWLVFLLCALFLSSPMWVAAAARYYVLERASCFVYEDRRTVPEADVAIVLGGARRFVRDRVVTAAELYRLGRVKRVLLTGDSDVDDVELMRRLALSEGVPPADLLVDGEADRTITSCRRARGIFGIKRALVVTQRFHLPRAIYLCREMGVDDAVGLVADRGLYGHARLTRLRETPASLRAVLDVTFAEIRSH